MLIQIGNVFYNLNQVHNITITVNGDKACVILDYTSIEDEDNYIILRAEGPDDLDMKIIKKIINWCRVNQL